MTQDPTGWFDQFPGLADGVEWPADSQWCARHWAPCPCLGANGIVASLMIQQIFLGEFATATSPAGLNAEQAAIGRMCCTLGDQRMYELWGQCPPSPPTEGGAAS